MLLSIKMISLQEKLILLYIPAKLITPGPLSRTYLIIICSNVPPKSLRWCSVSLTLRWISLHCETECPGLRASESLRLFYNFRFFFFPLLLRSNQILALSASWTMGFPGSPLQEGRKLVSVLFRLQVLFSVLY